MLERLRTEEEGECIQETKETKISYVVSSSLLLTYVTPI